MRALHEAASPQSNMHHEPLQESDMKRLALIAGVAFILLGIAGFAGLIPTLPMYNAVLAVAGVLFIMFGITGRRAIVPARGPGRDLRDLGGV